jgi:dsDNA-binding SOS-regulon protein
MSQTIEQAEEFRSKAISLLLAERQQIDDTLASLSYGAAQPQPQKVHRKKRTPEEPAADSIPSEA